MRDAALAPIRATIEDLFRVEGRAEIVNGEIIRLPLMGEMPAIANAAILWNLWGFVKERGQGRVTSSGSVYKVSLPYRLTFSPNVGYYDGPKPKRVYLDGPPQFAVEIRTLEEYGAIADAERAAKRLDYFAAGTQIVWDVDLLSRSVVRKYTSEAPNLPKTFRRGNVADAEPAVPGWKMPVDHLFR